MKQNRRRPAMERFLEKLAARLLEKYGKSLSELWLVFPNRRSSLFFRHYLSGIIDRPLWTPSFPSINDLAQKFSGLNIADPWMLNLELFDIHNRVRSTRESYDEFYAWGEILIADFNDLDKYLVDPGDLFQNLRAVKEIDYRFDYLSPEQKKAIQWFWQAFPEGRLSDNQQEFISLWSVLGKIYSAFRNRLQEQQLAYEGLCYRLTAEKILSGARLDIPVKKVILAGFNALSKSEHVLFDYLRKEGLAEFYWDYDIHYFSNGRHEAGHFMRENLDRYPQEDLGLPLDAFRNKPKVVHLLSASSRIAQAKYLHEVISSAGITGRENPDHFAVVLPDESMLIPTLNSLPAFLEEVNISLGYPLQYTQVYSLVDLFYELYSNARSKEGVLVAWSVHDLHRLIRHPLLVRSGLLDMGKIGQLLENTARMYIPCEELSDQLLFRELTPYARDVLKLAEGLEEILYHLFRHYSSISHPEEEGNGQTGALPGEGMERLQPEFIYRLHLVVERLKNLTGGRRDLMRSDTFLKLLKRFMERERVNFSGEPLAGIQLLGTLETRLLDFRNLVILSMNEGVWPKISHPPSYIPYSLRKGFGMPTLEHQDAIYSYYFYRLLQRSENVWILYNTLESGILSGEMSRYITQLKLESHLPLSEQTLAGEVIIPAARPILIPKDPLVMQWLSGYVSGNPGNRKLSPSAINTFIDCRLKYYFRYIAGIREPEGLTGEVDPARFGTLLHRAMYGIYRPHMGKYLTENQLKDMMQDEGFLRQSVMEAVLDELALPQAQRAIFMPEGNLLVVMEILQRYLLQILGRDMALAPFRIIALEKPVEMEMDLKVGNDTVPVRLGGTIDRVDQTPEGFRVIDYKTGKPEYGFAEPAELFDREKTNRNRAALQTLLYGWIWRSLERPVENLAPGLYYTRDMYREDFDSRLVMGKEKKAILDVNPLIPELEGLLRAVVLDLFDQDTGFSQTKEIRNCENCPYAGICHRH